MELTTPRTANLARFTRSLFVGLLAAFYCLGAQAALLGETLSKPIIEITSIEGPHQIRYEPSNATLGGPALFIVAVPTILQHPDGRNLPISGNPLLDLAVAINISDPINPAFASGAPGDDLVITGTVDLGGGDIRTGILLTGEVSALGYQHTTGVKDDFDFNFTITGGLLADLYPDTGGIQVVSEEFAYTEIPIPWDGRFLSGSESGAAGPVNGIVGAIAPPPVECPLKVTKSCFVAPPPPADFGCNKPIDTLTMIWAPEDPSRYDGLYPLTVKAYKGGSSSQDLLDTIPVANPGVEVSVSGIEGKSDVVWEVLDSSGNLLGESKYHLSCSDDDLDGETDDPAFPQDCGKRQGNAKDNNGELLNEWLLEGMVDSVGTLDCTPDAPPVPGTVVNECEISLSQADCTKRPTEIVFRYNAGDDCLASSNTQDDGKWSCEDFSVTPGTAEIGIGKELNDLLFDELVTGGASLKVSNNGDEFDSETQAWIRDASGNLVQKITLHSSCSQDLRIGDRFGALEVIGFTNEEQGTVSGSSEVTYTYTFENTSTDPIFIFSEDDKIGPIPADTNGFLQIPPNETLMHEETKLVDVTTTNTLTSTVQELLPLCERTASATVTVVGPGPGPGPGTCDVSPYKGKAPKLDSDKLEWKLKNNGSAPAVIKSIDISWPTANGNLKKVKLAGDLAKNLGNSGNASLTSFLGEQKDRTIKAGGKETLKLEFGDKIDKDLNDLGNYSISIEFEAGCSVSF